MDPVQSGGGDRAPAGHLPVGARGVGTAATSWLVVPAAGPAGSRTGPGDGGRMGEGDLARGKATAAALGAWIVFEDEAAVSMKPHRSRTWAPRGQTPVVPVRGASRGRISLAALACYKPGQTSRLIYRPRVQSHLKGAHRGFTWKDYRDLVVRAHLSAGARRVRRAPARPAGGDAGSLRGAAVHLLASAAWSCSARTRWSRLSV